MRKFFWILSILAVFPMDLHAQENTAVLFTGTMFRGSFSGMSAERNIFPGAEVRFNQNGRVTVGIGYQIWSLEAPSETDLMEFCPAGERCPIGGDKFINRHPQTGEALASFTYKNIADANMISSTAYLNLLTKGRVRPFVAFGGGVALIKETASYSTFVHPGIKNIIGREFRFENLDGRSESLNLVKPITKGLFGVNIFPGAHTMASFSGGYSSGKIFNFSFGFVF